MPPVSASSIAALAVALAGAVLLGSPRRAQANAAAAEFVSPQAAAGAWLASATSLAVEHEDLVIRCDGDGRDRVPVCQFEATYQVYNPTPEEREALGAFYGGRDVAITLDGQDARAAISPALLAALDASVARPSRLGPNQHHAVASLDLADPGRLSRSGFQIKVAASARARLVFAGQLDPVYHQNPSVYGGFAIPPHTTRHVALATPEDRDARARFSYLLSPLRTWAGARSIAVTISAPRRWPLAPQPLDGGDGPWTITRDGGRTLARARVKGDQAGDLIFDVTVPGHAVFNGGPFAAAGGSFGAGGGLRLRAGYEVARPAWVLYSLALESNARDRFAGVAVVEAALPNFFFIFPSLGLGAGPIAERHRGATSVGVRAQASAAFILLSAMLAADVFPGHSGAEDVVRWSLFGQISF
jgi:hypothetical protein